MLERSGTVVVFGETLVDEGSGAQAAGAPFNVARHLAAFLSPPLMITRVGEDRNGAIVRAEFERFVMPDLGLQVDPMEETGRALAGRGGQGQRAVLPPRQAYDFIDPRAAVAAMTGLAAPAAMLCFDTLVQREERSRLALQAVLASTPAKRFLDLNLHADHTGEAIVTRALETADIAKVNEEELQALFQWYFQIQPQDAPLSQDETHAACRALMDRFGLEALIVTLGHRGSVYFGADGGLIANRDNPAPPFVIDTAGAGDAFSAIFLLGQVRGWPLALTLARANEFAGAICAVSGAVPRDMNFYDKWVNRWREPAVKADSAV